MSISSDFLLRFRKSGGKMWELWGRVEILAFPLSRHIS